MRVQFDASFYAKSSCALSKSNAMDFVSVVIGRLQNSVKCRLVAADGYMPATDAEWSESGNEHGKSESNIGSANNICNNVANKANYFLLNLPLNKNAKGCLN